MGIIIILLLMTLIISPTFINIILTKITWNKDKLKFVPISLYPINIKLYDFYVTLIKNKEDFRQVWELIKDEVISADRARDVRKVNLLSYYAIYYYTNAVLVYGNESDIAVLRSYVKLMERNKFIDMNKLYKLYNEK